jgi:ABC-type multidrug transport system ATPase subunit
VSGQPDGDRRGALASSATRERLTGTGPSRSGAVRHMLAVENLSRRFGSHLVLTSFNFTLDAGERAALCGPNGSGKTTLLRCVAGTLTPSSGSIQVAGHTAGSIAARRLVGTSLAQERSFYLRLSGWANLVFFAQLWGHGRADAEARVSAISEELELAEILAERTDRCSTGMIQQLGFARALLGDPVLILLDEPTRSMDTAARARLWSALDRRRSCAVLLATHSPEDVERCDSTIELSSNR